MSQIGTLDEQRKTLATRIDMAIAQNEARHVQVFWVSSALSERAQPIKRLDDLVRSC